VSTTSRRGMTLVEIALAIAILAIMGTLTWGSLARSFDAYEAVNETDQRYHNVRLAMNRMAHELSMAFLTAPARDFGQEQMWKTIFQAKSGDIYELHFTSFAHEIMRENAKESDQCEISYFGDKDEEKRDQTNLMRREDPRIDREPTKGGVELVLAEDIKKFKLRFFDPKDDDWTEDWDTERPEYAGRLPTIIEITLEIEDENKKELKFLTKTRVQLPNMLQKF
jgi:general secretion pathway protein J